MLLFKRKNEMKKIILLLSVLVSGITAYGETIEVKEFKYAGSFSVMKPLMIDTVDVNSKVFETKSFLDAPLSLNALDNSETVTALPGNSDGYMLHLAGFIIENTMYAEAELKIEGTGNYRIFLDGKKLDDGKLKLEPATHEIALKYLTVPDEDVSLKVTLEKEKGGELSLGTGGKRMYTLSDVIHGTRFGGVDISPDGKYLIASYRINKAEGKTERFSRVTETATGRIVSETKEQIHWFPKSTLYYFERETDEGKQLVTVDPSTGTQNVIAENLPEGHFTVSPTEDYLLFMVEQEGPQERKDVYEVIHPDDRQPGWRTRFYLVKYDLSTGASQQLTYGYRNVWANDISADGRYVLMSVSTSRLTKRPTTLTTLYMLDVETLEAEELVAEDGFLYTACFSPDGTKVLLSGSPESLGGIGKKVKEGQTPSMIDNQLYLLNVSDKQITPLTIDFNPSITNFEWSRADNNVYFTAEDKDCVHLFRMDGKTLKISLVDVGEEIVKGFSLPAIGQTMACYGESATNSERLYTLNTKTLKTTLVRDLHAEQMSEIEFGECHGWDFVNSRGDTICGRYYLPPHFDSSKKYPMIVSYYGGCSPTSRDFEGRYPHHAYAALGYVVYIVEPSGATGFGQEFSARHVNTAGDYVADDIIEGTKKFCEDHPFVNSEKIGCIGASYGGFMTQYLQTKTDIFAAAISHAGISDRTSYWGEGYWGYSYSEVSMANSYPWTREDLYIDHSPLFNADKVHTPILFVHGDADVNVPVGESIQMYTALKLLGRETAMVLVKDQDHHILDYGKRIRWQATIFAWFAKWLQDDDSWWESMYAKKSL